MSAFATVQNLIDLWKPLTAEEQTRATALLADVSDLLRFEAKKRGKDLDAEVQADSVYATVVKDVTCDVTRRIMNQNADSDTFSQFSQSALGYSISGTYSTPGGGIANALMKNDLKRLGLKAQRAGKVCMYD